MALLHLHCSEFGGSRLRWLGNHRGEHLFPSPFSLTTSRLIQASYTDLEFRIGSSIPLASHHLKKKKKKPYYNEALFTLAFP